jgi:hypothetical protein
VSAHAKLSPSGAHRWMVCPGSVALETGLDDTGSFYADEGTAAHTLAAACLEGERRAETFLGEKITVGEREFLVDQEMADYVQDYVNLVLSEAEGCDLLVERRVPIGHITGEEGAGGTADAIIIDVPNRCIRIVDLKYGMGVKVDALDNAQLQMYALGAMDEYGVIGEFDEVSMIIHQPRLNHVAEFHVHTSTLEDFRRKASAAAERAYTAVNSPPEDLAEFLEAGPSQCKWCKAKAKCPALRNDVVEVVGAADVSEFSDFLPAEVGEDVGDNYLSIAMGKVALVEDWCKAVRAETERRLLAGEQVTGYKLVEGRKGARKWASEKEAERILKSFRLKQEQIYEHKLITPAKAEKLLKENPKRWAKLSDLIAQSMGKPSVAHAADKRSEMTTTTVAEDFDDLFETANVRN